jgi:voltage-gated potassium channel Kch
MLTKLLIGWSLAALCVVVHAIGMTAVSRRLKQTGARVGARFWLSVWLLVRVAVWIILLHLVEIALWAFFYAWDHGMPDLTSAFYFSAVTYTTTGYGDLVLPTEWRLVGGIEALTGILMCGWSAAFFVSVITRITQTEPKPERT